MLLAGKAGSMNVSRNMLSHNSSAQEGQKEIVEELFYQERNPGSKGPKGIVEELFYQDRNPGSKGNHALPGLNQ